jgi:2-dehydropantoate 2-reductase
MKHAILGAGAVGGLVGTALASLGEDVVVVVRPENLAGYPGNLTLERPQGSFSAPVKAAAELTERVDVLWIATKAYQLQTALEAVRSSPACAVPLLNGVDHVKILKARFGRDRVAPATIAVEAEKIAPGRFLQRSPFVRLSLAACGEPLLREVVAGLGNLGFTCQFVRNERTLLWSKLCFLAPFALATSASGMNKGEIYANAEWQRKFASAFAEACAVARASGAEVDPPKLQAFYDGMPSLTRSSMQKDLAAGRRLEVDAIAGPITRGGKRYGIDVSATVGLVAAIRAKIILMRKGSLNDH